MGTGGTIVADGGSNTTPINFTSIRNTTVDGNNSSGTTLLPAVGDWEGIFVMSAGSTFNFCNFSYSGSTYDYSDQAALVIQAGQTTVTNCSFDYNLVGLDLTGQGSGNTISGNGFSHNGTDHLP